MRLYKRIIPTVYLMLSVVLMLPCYGGGSVSAEGSAKAATAEAAAVAVAVQAEAPGIHLASDRQSYPLNDTIELIVKAREVTDLYAAKWDLAYDEQALSFVEGSAKPVFWTNGYMRTQRGPGILHQLGTKLGDTAGDSGDFTLVTMQFKPLKEGDTVIRLDRISGSNSGLQLLTFGAPAELRLRITPPDLKPPGEVTKAKSKEEHNRVTLTWENPGDEDLKEVRVYLNGELKASRDHRSEQADIGGLAPKTDYLFDIRTVDRVGNESAGTTVKAKTKNDTPPRE